MNIFIGWIVGGFLTAISSFVGRILVSLAIGYVTYQGIDVVMTLIKDNILANLITSYPEISAALSMLKIGQCINVTFSAIAVRNLLNGVSGGKTTKMVIK